MTLEKPNRLAWMAFGVVCIVWGTTFLGIRIGVHYLPPLVFTMTRLTLAGTIFLLLNVRRIRWRLLTPKILLLHLISGTMLFSVGSGFVGMAEVHISGGLAAVIASMIPVWVICINLIVDKSERPNLTVVAGILTGLAGIFLIYGEHTGFNLLEHPGAIILMFLAGLGWAGGSVWIRNYSATMEATGAGGFQLLFGGLSLIPLSLATEDWSTVTYGSEVIVVISYMVLVGSVFTYFCYLYALRRLPVTIISTYAYINPIVAMVLGWMLLDEKLNTRIITGMIITLLGVFLVNKGFNQRSAK
ncbi:MAG: DMT family transporter [Bacteroidota bacterium]